MSEEFDKTYVDCYNFIIKRLEGSDLDTDDKIVLIQRLYKDFNSLLVDKKIKELDK